MKNKSELVIPGERVENVVLVIRGEKVILGGDLAETPFCAPKETSHRVSSK